MNRALAKLCRHHCKFAVQAQLVALPRACHGKGGCHFCTRIQAAVAGRVTGPARLRQPTVPAVSVLQGLLMGIISTCMQAGFHHTASAGIDLLNLWPAVASINPLQFRMEPDSARQVGVGGVGWW